MTDKSHPTDPTAGEPTPTDPTAGEPTPTDSTAGEPTPGKPTPDEPAASWVGRLGLHDNGAGPSPWARRVGLAGAAAALVAVGGVGGFAVGHATGDGDRFRPTSFQVDGDGSPGERHGRGGHHGFGGEDLPSPGEGLPGDDGTSDLSGTSDTTT